MVLNVFTDSVRRCFADGAYEISVAPEGMFLPEVSEGAVGYRFHSSRVLSCLSRRAMDVTVMTMLKSIGHRTHGIALVPAAVTGIVV